MLGRDYGAHLSRFEARLCGRLRWPCGAPRSKRGCCTSCFLLLGRPPWSRFPTLLSPGAIDSCACLTSGFAVTGVTPAFSIVNTVFFIVVMIVDVFVITSGRSRNKSISQEPEELKSQSPKGWAPIVLQMQRRVVQSEKSNSKAYFIKATKQTLQTNSVSSVPHTGFSPVNSPFPSSSCLGFQCLIPNVRSWSC